MMEDPLKQLQRESDPKKRMPTRQLMKEMKLWTVAVVDQQRYDIVQEPLRFLGTCGRVAHVFS